jgi:hypothetical protein
LITRPILIALALMAGPATNVARAEPGLHIELSRLESVGASVCRVYFVTRNASEAASRSLRADLFTFGRDGVIVKRVAVQLAPLPARKTQVRMFDFDGAPCVQLSRVLLNDVVGCAMEADRPPGACLEAISTSSRVEGASFNK